MTSGIKYSWIRISTVYRSKFCKDFGRSTGLRTLIMHTKTLVSTPMVAALRAWNDHTPYTDFMDYCSGATLRVACKDFTRDLALGCVPGVPVSAGSFSTRAVGIVDCRGADGEKYPGGRLPDSITRRNAPFPGPYPGRTDYLQVVVNSHNNVGTTTRYAPRLSGNW